MCSTCTAVTFFEELLVGFPQDSCDKIRDSCCGAGCVDSAVFQDALPWDASKGYCEPEAHKAPGASGTAVTVNGGTQECAVSTRELSSMVAGIESAANMRVAVPVGEAAARRMQR